MLLTSAQKMAIDPESHCWVNANAGSGKTKVLIDRLFSLLLEDVPPERILCLTYTKAAASEMKKRLFDLIQRFSLQNDQEQFKILHALLGDRLTEQHVSRAKALQNNHIICNLKVQTVHSFCHSILNAFPFEADIKPSFNLIDDEEAGHLLEKAILSMMVSREHHHITETFKQFRLETLIEELKEQYGRFQKMIQQTSVDDIHTMINQYLNVANDSALLPCVLTDSEKSTLQKGNTTEQKILTAVLQNQDGLLDIDMLCSVFLYQSGERCHEPKNSFLSKKNQNQYPNLEQKLCEYATIVENRIDQIKAKNLAYETFTFFAFAKGVFHRYEQSKARQNALDFQDLITKIKALLADESIFPWIEMKLGYQIDHLLIDEAQDTSADQWAIVNALIRYVFEQKTTLLKQDRSIFAVGDGKQSIYSFQDAQPSYFIDIQPKSIQSQLCHHHKWRGIELDLSFRSNPTILKLVDAVFGQTSARSGTNFYDDQIIRHESYFHKRTGSVTLHPFFLPNEEPPIKGWVMPIKIVDDAVSLYASHIVDQVDRILQSHLWLDSENRTIKPHDIIILLQKRSPLFYHILRQLRDKGIPVSGPDRYILKDHLLVKDLLSLAQVITLPEDDLALACLLKSPFFNLTEDQLFDLCYDRSSSLWDALQTKQPNITECIEEFRDLYHNQLLLYDFYFHILYKHGYIHHFKASFTDADFVIAQFFDVMDNIVRNDRVAIPQFIESFEEQSIEVISSHQPDSIRVMTVHGSKGLESPVVFLVDTTSVPISKDSFLWVYDDAFEPRYFVLNCSKTHAPKKIKSLKQDKKTKDLQEYYRLLYVALTRACDHLVITGFDTPPPESWYSHILSAFNYIDPNQSDTGILRMIGNQILSMNESSSSCQHQPTRFDLKPITPSEPNSSEAASATQIGIDAHAYLEKLAKTPSHLWDDIEETSLIDANHLKKAFVQHIQPHLIENDWEVEMPMSGMFKGHFISSRLDLVIFKKDRVLIVDYKTSFFSEELFFSFQRQLEIYHYLLGKLYTDKAIEAHILWLHDNLMSRCI